MSDSQNVGFGFTVSTGVDASNFAVNQLPDVFGIVKGKLQLAANDSSFIAQVFGDKANTSEVQSIIGEWKIGVFGQLPSVQVISAADMNGADGAYASSTQKIYLSDSLFQSSAAPVDSVLGVAGVLTEETFHWLDDRVGADTQGDEGELAKGLLFRVKLSGSELVRIKSEDDRGFITLNGEKVLAEFAAYQMAAQENTDINGDGRADIVAFKNNGVYTSLSRVDGTFETARFAIGEYFTSTSSTGWKNNIEMPRMLADINGDGKADIVGFKNNGVYTSLSNGNGTFAAARFAIGEYFTSTSSTGWKNNIEMPRMLADINGDGKADIVGFKNNGVYTSLSNGDGTFAAARFAIGEYFTSTSSTGWKNNTEMPRMLADINGDGRADIVGFKNNGVYTSLSNGNGTFAAARFAIGEYFTSTSSTGWKNNTEMPRMLADINGDGRADIVGFKNNGVYTSLSNGNGTFAAARFAIGEYFTSTSSTGWKNNIEMPRLISGSIFIPRDDAGNSLLTARNISVGSTQANIKEWVGSFDTQDYYKFTLTNKSKLDLRLNGLTADANLRLLDVNGNLLQVSEQLGTASESIVRDLNAGTYYIQVSPTSGNNAIYNLSISATPSGYYRELFSLTDNDWDVQSGDNNQFEQNPLGGGGDQRGKTDDRIEQIYTDLSTSIFGSRRAMNTGYAFDTSYLSIGVGYHSGIDIQVGDTDTIKAAVNGVVAIAPYAEWLDRDKNGTKEFFNGWWMAIDETDASGAKTGRRWWYGHMKQPTTTFTLGTSVIGGQTVLANANRLEFGHLHLAVQNVKGSVGNGSSALDVQNRTISPLHAYWKAKNSIKESVIWS
jgi:murein DD-endopeptidase MepM/ murein hydrolase activator NlpD